MTLRVVNCDAERRTTLSQPRQCPGAHAEFAAFDARQLREREPKVAQRRVVRELDLPPSATQESAAPAGEEAGDVACAVTDPARAVVAAAVDDDAVIEEISVSLPARAQ